MGELKQLMAVIMGSIIIAVIGLLVFFSIPGGGAPVSASYNAVLNPDGVLTETFIYHIPRDREYTMLYRYWEAPLTLEEIDQPHIQLLSISCPSGSVPYIKDYTGHVMVWNASTSIYVHDIIEKAYLNEAGCYFPGKIPAGDHKVVYRYIVRPTLQCDGTYCHLNLKLARDHITYSTVNVTIQDPGGDVKLFYVHVPAYNVVREDKRIMVLGESPENQLLEIEFVYNDHGEINIPGYRVNDENVLEKTLQANNVYLMLYDTVKYSSYILLVLLLVYPLVLVGIYYWKGKEKKYVVPKYLSYVPDPKKKPWLVNLLFKGDALTIDSDAFYATILDLERKGYLEITGDKEHIVIKVKKSPGPGELDRYEQDVFEFIRYWSRDNVLDIEELKERVESMDSSRKNSLYEWMRSLITTPGWMKKLARNYVSSIRIWFILLASAFILGSLVTAITLGDLNIYAPYAQRLPVPLFMLGLQNIVAAIAPSQLFGRWKKDYYKEKLQWDAFKNMLKDFAMIQKYAPQDLVIWKEWLIYGTALGVGKKVVEAMEKLRIPVPSSGYFVYVWPRHYVMVMRTASPKKSGGVGSGGGFGAGGGFGGGGGGVR